MFVSYGFRNLVQGFLDFWAFVWLSHILTRIPCGIPTPARDTHPQSQKLRKSKTQKLKNSRKQMKSSRNPEIYIYIYIYIYMGIPPPGIYLSPYCTVPPVTHMPAQRTRYMGMVVIPTMLCYLQGGVALYLAQGGNLGTAPRPSNRGARPQSRPFCLSNIEKNVYWEAIC